MPCARESDARRMTGASRSDGADEAAPPRGARRLLARRNEEPWGRVYTHCIRVGGAALVAHGVVRAVGGGGGGR